jgi:DNA-binding GntR family transcriptional regulator
MKATRRALRHDVRDGLVRAIMDSRYGPGDRLIEMNIAREYGTSQGPVREALRELEVLGFVRSEPHRGTYVRDSWQKGMLELYQLRGALEEFATRLATPLLAGDVSALQDEVDAMAVAAADDDVEGVVHHSEAFHHLIIDASGNRLLSNVWTGLSIVEHTELTMVALPIDLASVPTAHQPIVDAIANGDVEAACRESRDHQVFFMDLLQETATEAQAS